MERLKTTEVEFAFPAFMGYGDFTFEAHAKVRLTGYTRADGTFVFTACEVVESEVKTASFEEREAKRLAYIAARDGEVMQTWRSSEQ